MPKINMLYKDKEHNSQMVGFDPQLHNVLGTSDTENIKQLERDSMNKGHALFKFGSDEFYTVYVSKKTDGFAREVTKENWERKMPLNVYEKEQRVWVSCVENYFKFMMEDEDTKDEIRAECREALLLQPINGNEPFDLPAIINEARDWLCEQAPTKEGGSGKRKTAVWKFLCGNGKTKYKTPTAWIKRAVFDYVKKNTPYKKKWK